MVYSVLGTTWEGLAGLLLGRLMLSCAPGASAEQPAAGKLCKLTPLSSMRRRTGVPGSHVEALEVPGVILA